MKSKTSRQQHVQSYSSNENDLSQIINQIDDEERKLLLQSLVSNFGETLEPMTPAEGIDSYLQSKSGIRAQTKADYRRKLEYFLTFTEKIGIDQLHNLTGRHLAEYRNWRREESTDEVESLSQKTMEDDMRLLNDFIEYLESIEAVTDGLSDKVTIPTADDPSRDIKLDADRLTEIKDYLRTYQYASLEHATLCLLSDTGRRLGAIVGLDLSDYHPDDSDPHVVFHHRPSQTPLKNGEDGEGPVTLTHSHEVLSDYIDIHRHDVEDEYGRQPLLTTSNGRPAKSTLRRYVYKVTRPCHIGKTCPHGRSPDTCEAAARGNKASQCESSRSPHALRHSYLTELVREDAPMEVISNRCDVSEQTLELYYDERSEEEKRQLRKAVLEDLQTNGGGYL